MAETFNRWCFKKRGAIIVVALVLPVVSYAAWSTYVMQTPAISNSAMEQLHVGMTSDEVRALLGDPTGIAYTHERNQRWVYCPGTWAIYSIEFDANGRITKDWHDY